MLITEATSLLITVNATVFSAVFQTFSLRANITAGTYHLLTFSSGILLGKNREEPENPAKLLIGDDDNAKFTKPCRYVSPSPATRLWHETVK